MHTENHIVIEGPADRVFALAADIASWPRWLPHYRWVKVFEDDGRRRVAEMAALRNRFPVKWKAVQVLAPDERRITFRHIGGVTKGMWVEWRITERDGVTDVVIAHDLDYPVPVLGKAFADLVIGRTFVQFIAGKTLARLKRRVEEEARAEAPATTGGAK